MDTLHITIHSLFISMISFSGSNFRSTSQLTARLHFLCVNDPVGVICQVLKKMVDVQKPWGLSVKKQHSKYVTMDNKLTKKGIRHIFFQHFKKEISNFDTKLTFYQSYFKLPVPAPSESTNWSLGLGSSWVPFCNSH